MRTLLLIALVLTISACRTEWVELTDAAESVSLAQPAEIADCERVGTATVESLDRIGFVERSSRQLQNELVRLARNEAGDMGADRIVAESTIDNGRQTFAAYRCP